MKPHHPRRGDPGEKWRGRGILALAFFVVSGVQAEPSEWWDWRAERFPRVQTAPNPAKVQLRPAEPGWVWVEGLAGCAGDREATWARVVNLNSGDAIATPLQSDGTFRLKVFGPPGSALQINTSRLSTRDLPPHLHRLLEDGQSVTLSEQFGPLDEALMGRLGGDPSSSPGTLLSVSHEEDGLWPGFARRFARRGWCYGRAWPSATALSPGATLRVRVELEAICETAESARAVLVEPPFIDLGGLHCLFDAQGLQRPHQRNAASHLLTPTGLPIETWNEMGAEARPDGRRVWVPLMSGWPIPWHAVERGRWRIDGRRGRITQKLECEIPSDLPAGYYGFHLGIGGLGKEEFDGGVADGSYAYLGYIKVGQPAPPRLTCLLFGSSSPGGYRGAIAREDRPHLGLNGRIIAQPEQLVLPRDDAYTGRPIRYPMDPYAILLSAARRPAPHLPAPRIPMDWPSGQLQVRIRAPSGAEQVLGPAPVSGQNDMSVLRPDYVIRHRRLPPVPPTYGNPSLSDILHLSGRGAFDFAFAEYGQHVIHLAGSIRDLMGQEYEISGTFDVFIARPLDVEVFPELGTPLEPKEAFRPQVRVQPALPAEVTMTWRHYPDSDPARLRERRIAGRANRWGVFLPGPEEVPVCFDDPGEYVVDVEVKHMDEDGACWMSSRRGASVVVTPDSKVVVHGERGNRSPSARWRARWFVAGDNRFVAPPERREPRPPEPVPPEELPPQVEMGLTCYPYESGDVAWLGPSMAFSFFPNVTFEDPEGTIANRIEARWPGLRWGEGRAGLYPHRLLPEDRRTIGELPYVCMTASGAAPCNRPEDIDLWGYFYTTSWRPGVGVRFQVSEDLFPTGYWFFDDPYAYQFGNGPQGDLAGDFKMNYAGGVFRDETSGLRHYGAYASMLVLIDPWDPLGARVLPPFDGLLPGAPPSGPLLEWGGRRYDAFLTFGAVSPGAILERGQGLSLTGVAWPPVSGQVQVEAVSPSGNRFTQQARISPMGLFDCTLGTAGEPGLWQVSATGILSGRTSLGVIAECVPETNWPRATGLGLEGAGFELPVVTPGGRAIAFDLPAGTCAAPPVPLRIRGRLPDSTRSQTVTMVVTLPGMVMTRQNLAAKDGVFEYCYDPRTLRQLVPNLDTRIEVPGGGFEFAPAWFDTVTFSFWAGAGEDLVAGTVLLQGEEVYAQTTSGHRADPVLPSGPGPGEGPPRRRRPGRKSVLVGGEQGTHSSLLVLADHGRRLFAAHPWSEEVVHLDVLGHKPRLVAKRAAGGRPRSIALSPDEKTLFVALGDRRQILRLDAASLKELGRLDISGAPYAVLPSNDGKALFLADFDGDRIQRVEAETGQVEAESEYLNRPAALALSADGLKLFASSFRTGEILVLDAHCQTLRKLEALPQLNQGRTLTIGPDRQLFAPQIRSDTRVGGRAFDKTIFPVIATANPESDRVEIGFFPDTLVIPPNRPMEVAVDEATVYLASAGSDDVLAIDRKSGFALWHAEQAGQEPGGLVLDPLRRHLYLLAVTSQEIIRLDADSGSIMSRMVFTHDPTPLQMARGRYLFGTATDSRLAKDRWISCASCHPDGGTDGRQWDLGRGPTDTRALAGCLQHRPLHYRADSEAIQDLEPGTRVIMGGRWFVVPQPMHAQLNPSSKGLDPDLDALAAYVESLPTPVLPPITPEQRTLIEAGRQLFFDPITRCATCHKGAWYSDSGTRTREGQFLRHDVGTRAQTAPGGAALDTPSLVGLRRADPYLHHGRAKTLEEVLTQFNPEDRHGVTSHLNGDEIKALAEFLRYLVPRQGFQPE